MKNKTNILQGKTTEAIQLQVSHPSATNEAVIINLPVEKRVPPVPPKELPVSKWKMPETPQGYFRGNDNDCL